VKKQLAVCAGLWLLGLGSAGPAAAQAIYAGPGRPEPALPPYEVMSIVRSTGLTPLTRPMLRGPYYVLVAVDRVGRQMRVVVDAQLGDIVNLRPALAAASYGPELARPNPLPGVAPLPDPAIRPAPYGPHASADYGVPPAPPRTVPNPRPANAPGAAAPTVTPPPTHLAVAEPGLPALPPPPPLPRPRPNLALNEAPTPAPGEAPVVAPAGKPPGATPPSAAPHGSNDAAQQIE
jgi:hypothetical protein